MGFVDPGQAEGERQPQAGSGAPRAEAELPPGEAPPGLPLQGDGIAQSAMLDTDMSGVLVTTGMLASEGEGHIAPPTLPLAVGERPLGEAKAVLIEGGTAGSFFCEAGKPAPRRQRGVLCITNRNVCFCATVGDDSKDPVCGKILLPRPLVYKVDLAGDTGAQAQRADIWTKTGERISLCFPSGECPVVELQALSSGSAPRPPSGNPAPQGPYDGQMQEWERMGVLQAGSGWRVDHEFNASFSQCKSYPPVVAVPVGLSQALLQEHVRARSSNRFAALSWRCPKRNIAICRSSQPNVGLSSTLTDGDALAVYAAAESEGAGGGAVPRLVLVECRSVLAAQGNRLKGGGSELSAVRDRFGASGGVFRGGFCNMGNIHEVRSAFEEALQGPGEDPMSRSSVKWAEAAQRAIDVAQWLAEELDKSPGAVALVHCSDGWDRTSQIVALAQVLLDPYARTPRGFAALVRRDFLAFGHRFGSRNDAAGAGHECCPVWLQFLDCVGRLLQRQPSAFGFSVAHLRRLAYVTLSGSIPAFSYDNERDRVLADAPADANSLAAILEEDPSRYGARPDGTALLLSGPCEGLCCAGGAPPAEAAAQGVQRAQQTDVADSPGEQALRQQLGELREQMEQQREQMDKMQKEHEEEQKEREEERRTLVREKTEALDRCAAAEGRCLDLQQQLDKHAQGTPSSTSSGNRLCGPPAAGMGDPPPYGATARSDSMPRCGRWVPKYSAGLYVKPFEIRYVKGVLMATQDGRPFPVSPAYTAEPVCRDFEARWAVLVTPRDEDGGRHEAKDPDEHKGPRGPRKEMILWLGWQKGYQGPRSDALWAYFDGAPAPVECVREDPAKGHHSPKERSCWPCW